MDARSATALASAHDSPRRPDPGHGSEAYRSRMRLPSEPRGGTVAIGPMAAAAGWTTWNVWLDRASGRGRGRDQERGPVIPCSSELMATSPAGRWCARLCATPDPPPGLGCFGQRVRSSWPRRLAADSPAPADPVATAAGTASPVLLLFGPGSAGIPAVDALGQCIRLERRHPHGPESGAGDGFQGTAAPGGRYGSRKTVKLAGVHW